MRSTAGCRWRTRCGSSWRGSLRCWTHQDGGVGKAARNRALKAKQLDHQHERAAVRDVVGEVLKLQTYDAFATLLTRHPELLGTLAIDELTEVAQSPGYGPLIARALRLLEGARSDPRAAWDTFTSEGEAIETVAETLGTLEARIDEAEGYGDLAEALALIDQALPIAQEIGYGLSVCHLLDRRGSLLCRLSAGPREQHIEDALLSLEGALEVAVAGEQAARILMHRGLAYSERVLGEPDENAARAVGSMRDALSQLDGCEDPELVAAARTNLAVALIRRARDQPAGAREAVTMCRQALAYRSPERHVGNWAYSQINLAYALHGLVAHQQCDIEEVRAAYEQVLAHSERIADRALVGSAHHGLGRLGLQRARLTPAAIVAADQGGTLDELYETEPALRRAVEHLTIALELTPEHSDGMRHTHILDDLSSALDQLGDSEQALEHAKRGLARVTIETAPALARSFAGRLGALHAVAGDWRQSAEAYATALAAAEVTLDTRLDTTGRESERENAGNLHRWAAYSLARAGLQCEAALALEAGQARELQRRLGTPDAATAELLEGVPAPLRASYEQALDDYRQTPIGLPEELLSRRLGEAIAAIRQQPGLSDFPGRVTWQRLARATTPDWPLVYLDPTPHGTLILLIADGDTDPAARFATATSTEIFMHLAVGGADVAAAQERESGSYLIGASGQGAGESDLAGNLDRLLPWLGRQVMAPLAELLADRGSCCATVVACGTLNSAPLHAALFEDGTAILDKHTIRYAPSAATAAATIERARSAAPRPRKLVVLADPVENLPAARPEAQEIAALFPDGRSTVAIGSHADRRFLAHHARHATHLHFACHARGGLFDTGEAEILLASGPLPASEVPTLVGLHARLVVVSACQGAQPTIARLANEHFSIATAMIAAGAACAIASLWPVYDLATALLMTRLYEQLAAGSDPATALRGAQLWLRELTREQRDAFLQRHPHLAAEQTRRSRGSSRETEEASAGPWSRPYTHPEFWAPFLAVGA